MKVNSGCYEDAGEVIRAGLRTLERDEQEQAAKLAALRQRSTKAMISSAEP